MAHLVDTSVLARLANTAGPYHAVAADAVLELHRRGEVLHVTPQNLVEFRRERKGVRFRLWLEFEVGGGNVSPPHRVRRAIPERNTANAICLKNLT